MAKKFNKKKAFLCFLGWTLLYFPVVIYYVYHDLGINLLSPANIQYKYNGFVSGQWSMNTTDTLLFLGTIILFIPVWIVGTVMLYKIDWNRPKIFKEYGNASKKKLILNVHNDSGSKPKMPIKLKLQSAGQFSSLHTHSNVTDTQKFISDETHALLSTVEKNNTEQIISELLTIASAYHTETFTHVNLDGYEVPLAISTDNETAILITVVNEPDSQLIVDVSDNIEADWFGTLAPLPSPAKFIKEAAQKLKDLEPTSEVIPVIVLAAGEISDCDQVVSMLNQNGIMLTRFGQGKPKTLETIETFLDNILSSQNTSTKKTDNFPTEQDDIPTPFSQE